MCERTVFFTDCLGNSSTMKEQIVHQKMPFRTVFDIQKFSPTDIVFQHHFILLRITLFWFYVGKFFLPFSTSKNKVRKEFNCISSCWKIRSMAAVWKICPKWKANSEDSSINVGNNSEVPSLWLKDGKVFRLSRAFL